MSQESLTIFTVPEATRIRVRTTTLGVEDQGGSRSATFDRIVWIECSATASFGEVHGALRRRFVNVDPPVGRGDDDALWLSDAEIQPDAIVCGDERRPGMGLDD